MARNKRGVKTQEPEIVHRYLDGETKEWMVQGFVNGQLKTVPERQMGASTDIGRFADRSLLEMEEASARGIDALQRMRLQRQMAVRQDYGTGLIAWFLTGRRNRQFDREFYNSALDNFTGMTMTHAAGMVDMLYQQSTAMSRSAAEALAELAKMSAWEPVRHLERIAGSLTGWHTASHGTRVFPRPP